MQSTPIMSLSTSTSNPICLCFCGGLRRHALSFSSLSQHHSHLLSANGTSRTLHAGVGGHRAALHAVDKAVSRKHVEGNIEDGSLRSMLGSKIRGHVIKLALWYLGLVCRSPIGIFMLFLVFLRKVAIFLWL